MYIFMTSFCEFVNGVQLPPGYTEPLRGDSLFLTRNPWYSLDQYWKDGKLRWPWSYPVVLSFCINLVITKYKLKSQFKLTEWWSLTVSCFKVSSQSYLPGLSKECFFCTYVDQITIKQVLSFCFKFSFTIVLLMFFWLFSNVFTNILKIYELTKIDNKILKKLLTIIIYQVNSMSQLHLPSELYWKCTLGSKRIFWH